MFKDTNRFPPGRWQFEEGNPVWHAPDGLTFDALVRKVRDHRLGNPHLGRPTDVASVTADVVAQNGKRINYNPTYWVADDAQKKMTQSANPAVKWFGNPWFAKLARLAAKIKQSVTGARTLQDWLGEGGLPVTLETATERANVCEGCPLNEKGDWTDKVTGAVAEAIKDQRSAKLEMKLEVPNESELGTCGACGCHLPLKVWVPLKYINEEMDEETKAALDPRCWVTKEKWQTLLLVIPFCKSDYKLAVELLKWIGELGGCPGHDCLLVADCKVSQHDQAFIVALAAASFKSVQIITTPHSLPNESWPSGPNWMFQTTLRHVHENYSQPFYWCEPDCIPLKEGWLNALEVEYNIAGKPFMGRVVSSSGQENVPADHLTGCAIYPQNAHELLESTYTDNRAFDMAMAPIVLPLTHNTDQQVHFWGQKNLPPTLRKGTSSSNPRNTLLVDFIPPDSKVFHRSKDLSLIKLLREARS